METERIWDFTRVSTYQQCPKKYYFRMIKNLVPLTAPALLFGKAMHIALETYYKELSMGAKSVYGPIAVERAVKAFKDNYTDQEGNDKRTCAQAEKVLKGYAEVYLNEPIKIISTEVGFAIPVFYGNGKSFILCGRLDALVDWNGALYVLEHKTTSMLNVNYFYSFEMSHQVDGYVYAAEQHTGRKCLGAIINALELWKDVAKPTAKTKQLADHYARDPQSRSEYELKEYREDLGVTIENIIEAEKLNRFPRNKQACFSYNYKCPYWSICKYGDDEKSIAREFRIEAWEPYKNGGDNVQ